jgi:hypothetical protein
MAAPTRQPNAHNVALRREATKRARRAGYLAARDTRYVAIATELGVSVWAVNRYHTRYPGAWRAGFRRGEAAERKAFEARREKWLASLRTGRDRC